MKGIKRFAVIAIAIAAFVAVLALNVFALEPDSELTVIQEYPEAPLTGASLPESAGTEAAAAASDSPSETAEVLSSAGAALTEAMPGTVPAEAVGTVEAAGTVEADPTAAEDSPATPAEEILIIGSDTLAVGENTRFSAVVLPETAQEIPVAWSTTDSSIAAISADGTATGISAGRVEIVAEARDGSGARAAQALNVYVPEAEAVANVPASLRLGVGQAATVHWSVLPVHAPQQVSFTTSNKNIATVTADGQIQGVKPGSCTVTVATPNGRAQSCRVEVLKAPKAISLNRNLVQLGMDAASDEADTFQLKPRIADDTATAFSYRSGNSSIVQVSDSGLITACGFGETTVVVSTHNGVSAICHVTVLRAPRSVSVTGVLALSVGDTLQTNVVLQPADSAGGVIYTSSNPNVMTISAGGRITGCAVGTANLTVTTFNGRSTSRRVNVYPAPEKISAVNDSITIGVGEKRALEAWLEPATARSSLTYASSAKKNVTVDENGTITGVRAGTATITITTYNGKKDTVKVTVKKAPGKVSLNAEALTLGWDARNDRGETFNLNATVSSGSAGACEFVSSDPWVARVDSRTGKVTARAPGECVITVTAYNGATAECRVTVEAAATGLELTDELLLGVGQSYALEPVRVGGVSRLTYTSSDSAVVSVSQSGALAAHKAGAATVTVSTFNGCQASVQVEVRPAPGKLTLAQRSATIGVGGEFQIVPVIPEGTAAGFTYKSGKAAVASVSADGVVTGVGPGTTTITVKAHNGRTNTFSITVVKAPTSLTLNRTELTMQPTEAQVLKATLSKGSAAAITFTSSDERVAVVDGAGTIEALTLGECVITVATGNGLTAECAVRVLPGPAAIRVPADLQIGTSELIHPEIEILNAEGAVYADEYTLTSSNSGVVSVSGTSLLGRRKGTATITVRSHTVTAAFNVEVIKYGTLYPTLIIAHRGASSYVTDNTIEAFQLAHEMHADGVELDVRRTKDGELVVFHDATIEVDGVKRRIADLTLEEVQAIDLNGCRVPTLDAALDYLKSTGMLVQVELKEEGVGGDSAEAVRRHNMGDQVIFVSFSLSSLSEAKYEDPTARLAYLCRAVPTDIARLAQQYELYALLPRQAIVNESLVNKVHAAGLRLGTWTINDAESIAQLSQMGVDYIATDRPDLALNSVN